MIVRAPRRRFRGLGYESCDPRDSACVQRVTAQSVSDQQQNAINQTNAARDLCHANANRSEEPWRTQLNAECDSRYPAGAATGGESIQFWNTQATDDARANVFDTAAQQSADYNAEQDRRAAVLRSELARAGQTFIPDAARPPSSTSSVIPPKSTPVLPGGSRVVIQSSGVQNAPGGMIDDSNSGSGFSLSSIPVWGWALLVGGGLYAMGGRR